MSGRRNEIVWLTEERTYGELLSLGAHYSMVRYTRGGIDYEVLVSNDEFDIKYDGEDDDGDTPY